MYMFDNMREKQRIFVIIYIIYFVMILYLRKQKLSILVREKCFTYALLVLCVRPAFISHVQPEVYILVYGVLSVLCRDPPPAPHFYHDTTSALPLILKNTTVLT